MKLRLTGTDFSAVEEWKRKNRKPHIYPPPDDGQEWILLDEAAALYGIKPRSMAERMRRLNFTRTSRHGVKIWLVKKEVMDYLAFLKDRERWYKARRPHHWEPEIGSYEGESDEYMQRIFWTTAQAAAFMGVGRRTIIQWARQGKIPVFLTRKKGEGGRNWYSPTSLRNLKEDEDYQKAHAIYEKGKDTLRQGVLKRELYAARHKPRTYPTVPKQWLTVREVAERLQIGTPAVRRLRKMERFVARQFVGAWDSKRRPWFIHEDSVEKLKNDTDYQKMRRRGQKAVEAMIGKQIFPDPDAAAPPKPNIRQHAALSFGYTQEEHRITMPPEMW